MGNDDQPKGEGLHNIVSLVERTRPHGARDWVQAIPGLSMKDVLEEATVVLGCIGTLTRQALNKPGEAQTLMRASYYLSGMAKAMIQGQVPEVHDKGQR
jgi:hypothetical protein